MTSPQPPTSVPGYNLGERLGAGSYAVVFKALTAGAGSSGVREVVAIKCMEKKRVKSTKAAMDNLEREIFILKRMRHRNIVQLIDFKWDQTHIFLIMEYCSGGDLSMFIRTQRCLGENVTRKFLRQLACAIQYLRSFGIAHMDLKPHNILLSNLHNPVLKVGDFGFAQHLSSDERQRDFKGSPLYMAPEMLSGRSYDARVDLWSIGVILYECLFGRAPFASGSIEELIRMARSDAPVRIGNPPGGQLSDSCRDLLERLLKRDPNERLSFDEFFVHQWVDVEHAPSDESLPKALELAKRAVAADEQGRIARAVRLYLQALDYFVPALQVTESKSAKEQLRQKTRKYLRRAEHLKSRLRPHPEPTDARAVGDRSTAGTPRLNEQVQHEQVKKIEDRLRLDWADRKEVGAALTVVSAAESLELQDKWEEALAKYQLAVESMLQLLAMESPSARRDALRARVDLWLRRAEALQDYCEIAQLQLSAVEAKEAEAIETEEATEKMVQQQNCALQ